MGMVPHAENLGNTQVGNLTQIYLNVQTHAHYGGTIMSRKSKKPKTKIEKERYICSNHEPLSCIFNFRPTKRKPIPMCPVCNDDEFLAGYSGDKKPNVAEIIQQEKDTKINNGKLHAATITKRRQA